MRLKQEIRHFGFFWRPNRDNNKVNGLLTIKDNNTITLETFGNILGHDDEGNLGRVFGFLDNGVNITLEFCSVRSNNTIFAHSSHYASTEIQADIAFFGAHFDVGDDIRIKNISFSLEHINDWIDKNDLRLNDITTHPYKNESKHRGLNIFNNGELSIDLIQSIRRQSDDNHTFESRHIYFDVNNTVSLNIEHLVDAIVKIQAFLIFAFNHYTSINNIRSNFTDCIDGSIKEIEIFWDNRNRNLQKNKLSKFNMFILFNEIRDELNVAITRWLELCDIIEPSIFLYIKTKEQQGLISDFDFLALAQALESLHRRIFKSVTISDEEYKAICDDIVNKVDTKHKEKFERILAHGNEVKFSQRLKELMNPFIQYYGSKKVNTKLISKIVILRNYLTHYDETDKAKEIYENNFFDLAYAMDNLLKINLLSLLNLSEDTFNRVLSRRFNKKV